MRRTLLIPLLLLLAAGPLACTQRDAGPVAPGPGKSVLEEWLVRFTPGADAAAVAADFLSTLTQNDPDAEVGVLLGNPDPVALLADARVRALQLNRVVALSEPVEITQGFHEGDWEDEEIAGQPALASLDLNKAHLAARGEGILVAVLDTGVESTHGHLAGRLLMTSQIPPDLGQEETNNGIDEDLDGDTDEAYGHGTHVAGIVLTVAPAATVLPIRIMNDDGNGFAFNLSRGLYYAKELGADVVNLSLVLSNDSDVVHSFLEDLANAGIVVVAAAGNTPGTVGYPATDIHTVGVAATDAADALATFSGSGAVPFAAPGVAVESSYPGNLSAHASGTSMATPVVSGAFALMLCCKESSVPLATALLAGTVDPVAPSGAVLEGRVDPTDALFPWTPPRIPRIDGRKLNPDYR